MMRLTSVTCGSVSLSVSPGGRSHTCKGRVCFGGFIFFFFQSAQRTEEKCISVGKAPFACWLERGLGSGWHLVAEALLFGVMGQAKSRSWGERGSRGRCGGQMPRGRRSPQRRQQH